MGGGLLGTAWPSLKDRQVSSSLIYIPSMELIIETPFSSSANPII